MFNVSPEAWPAALTETLPEVSPEVVVLTSDKLDSIESSEF